MLTQGDRPFKGRRIAGQRQKAPKDITHFRKTKVFSMVSAGSSGKITT